MDKLTIGKMAKLNGVSPQTLRLYDRIKLLEPCETNPETGYRYYHIKQCAQLDMIQYMKALGMNLAQITFLLQQFSK
ncbi:MAG: MerR family transcriptional regulator [Anaerovoracaceae bacterium]